MVRIRDRYKIRGGEGRNRDTDRQRGRERERDGAIYSIETDRDANTQMIALPFVFQQSLHCSIHSTDLVSSDPGMVTDSFPAKIDMIPVGQVIVSRGILRHGTSDDV